MKTRYTMLAACLLAIASCQKESFLENKSVLQGNYAFVSMQVEKSVTDEVIDEGDVNKAISNTRYVTRQNSGSIHINATSLNSTNLSYSVDTQMEVAVFNNGVPEENFTVPFNFDLPPVNSFSNYKLVGTDSLYFPSGWMFVESAAQQPTTPSGCRFRVEGDLLYLTVNTAFSKSEHEDGFSASTIGTGQVVITLQKQ